MFSKSFVLASPGARAATRDVLFGRYLPKMERAATEGKPLEVLELNYAYSMDTFVQWQYGSKLGSNFLEDEEERRMYLNGFSAPYPHLFWIYYFPGFAREARKIGLHLIPDSVGRAFGLIEDWNLEKCDTAYKLLASGDKLDPEEVPVVFQQAAKTMSGFTSKPGEYPQRLDMASDMFAHNSAAFETSGNTETFLLYEMSRKPEWQTRLRRELDTLKPPLLFRKDKSMTIEELPDPRIIDELPVLHAVVMETLRLYPSVPGGQPRVTPKTTSLGGYDNIPAGTIVHCSAYILHRTPEVFPDPDEWKPERWLDASPEELTTMKHWFWAFGSGARMCIGSNFAFYCEYCSKTHMYSIICWKFADFCLIQP